LSARQMSDDNIMVVWRQSGTVLDFLGVWSQWTSTPSVVKNWPQTRDPFFLAFRNNRPGSGLVWVGSDGRTENVLRHTNASRQCQTVVFWLAFAEDNLRQMSWDNNVVLDIFRQLSEDSVFISDSWRHCLKTQTVSRQIFLQDLQFF
jgi:hypothetical protein